MVCSTAPELLLRRSLGATSDEDVLVFRHSLVRDAAYRMIPERDLASYHERASAWFEACAESDAIHLTDAAEHAERAAQVRIGLGEHLSAAYALARAARLWLSAHRVEPATESMLSAFQTAEATEPPIEDLLGWLRTFLLAVTVSRRDRGIREATAWAIRWVDRAGTAEDRSNVRALIARALGAANDLNSAWDLLDEATLLAESVPEQLKGCLLAQADIAMRSGAYKRGIRAIDRLSALGPVEDPWTLLMFAMLRATAGDGEASERALSEAIARAPKDDPVLRAEIAKMRAMMAIHARDFRRGAELSELAAQEAQVAGLTANVAANYHNRADCLRTLGELSAAREAFELSLQVARQYGFRRLVVLNEIYLAFLDGIAGISGQGAIIEALLESATLGKFQVDLTEGTLLLGLLRKHEGDGRARETLSRAKELAVVHGNRLVEKDAREALLALDEGG